MNGVSSNNLPFYRSPGNPRKVSWRRRENPRRILLSTTFRNFVSPKRDIQKFLRSNDSLRKTPPIFPAAEVRVLSAVWNNKFSNVGRFHPSSFASRVSWLEFSSNPTASENDPNWRARRMHVCLPKARCSSVFMSNVRLLTCRIQVNICKFYLHRFSDRSISLRSSTGFHSILFIYLLYHFCHQVFSEFSLRKNPLDTKRRLGSCCI